MAVMQSFQCPKCLGFKREAHSDGATVPITCHSCQQKEADEKRRRHFRGLDGLTVEGRLRKVEEWIYDYKPPVDPMRTVY